MSDFDLISRVSKLILKSLIILFCVYRKKPIMSFTSAMSMATTKKKMAADARENVEIKKEEEITKREKTLIDQEAAEKDKEKLQEKK